MQYKKNKIKDFEIHYFTTEMTVEEIYGEFYAFLYFLTTSKLTDIDQIFSIGDNIIPKEVEAFIFNNPEIEEYLTIFEEKVHLYNEAATPNYMYKKIQEIARNNGTITTEKYKDNDGKEVQAFKSFTPTDPDKFITIIYDNFQKIKTHKGQTRREAIEMMSGYLDLARFHFGFVVCALQQINRTSKTFDRYKLEQYFPSEQDLKDSEAPFHDCQVCIVQISPLKLGLKTFFGYDSERLDSRFRAFKIIKNRGGEAFNILCAMFLGENAIYKELPENMSEKDYLYISNLKKEPSIRKEDPNTEVETNKEN